MQKLIVTAVVFISTVLGQTVAHAQNPINYYNDPVQLAIIFAKIQAAQDASNRCETIISSNHMANMNHSMWYGEMKAAYEYLGGVLYELQNAGMDPAGDTNLMAAYNGCHTALMAYATAIIGADPTLPGVDPTILAWDRQCLQPGGILTTTGVVTIARQNMVNFEWDSAKANFDVGYAVAEAFQNTQLPAMYTAGNNAAQAVDQLNTLVMIYESYAMMLMMGMMP